MLVLAACSSDGEESTGTDEGTKTEDTTKDDSSEEGAERSGRPAAEDSDALFPLVR